MRGIDTFAALLLEEAKRFLAKADDSNDEDARNANLHAALLLGFCSLEAHVNAMASEFLESPNLSQHERAILLEKEVRLDSGEFTLTNRQRFVPLQERILFLYKRFSKKAPDRKAPWWGALGTAIELRHQLTHPKKMPTITVEDVKRAIQAVLDTLDALFRAIYRSKFPAARMGLHSTADF